MYNLEMMDDLVVYLEKKRWSSLNVSFYQESKLSRNYQ